MSGNNGPMLKAVGLWAKSSVKGGQYFTGRLGGVKVLVLENRDRQGNDDPVIPPVDLGLSSDSPKSGLFRLNLSDAPFLDRLLDQRCRSGKRVPHRHPAFPHPRS